jgi:hypothetical protein
MNTFAFKCTKCDTVSYSNTTRRISMRCSKRGAFNMKRSAKDDR